MPESKGPKGRLCRVVIHNYKSLANVSLELSPLTVLVGRNGVGKSNIVDALSISDGTLRALGVLLAAYQPRTPTVLGIEEPEATVHPAIAESLYTPGELLRIDELEPQQEVEGPGSEPHVETRKGRQ